MSEAPEVLILVMKTKANARETLKRCLLCFAKLSTNKEHAQNLANRGVVAAVVETLLVSGDDDKYLCEVIRVLVNLSILEENAIAISETATGPLTKFVDTYF